MFFGLDFITVNKDPDVEWNDIRTAVYALISDHMSRFRLQLNLSLFGVFTAYFGLFWLVFLLFSFCSLCDNVFVCFCSVQLFLCRYCSGQPIITQDAPRSDTQILEEDDEVVAMIKEIVRPCYLTYSY